MEPVYLFFLAFAFFFAAIRFLHLNWDCYKLAFDGQGIGPRRMRDTICSGLDSICQVKFVGVFDPDRRLALGVAAGPPDFDYP
jgi:hypothetical protein